MFRALMPIMVRQVEALFLFLFTDMDSEAQEAHAFSQATQFIIVAVGS